MSRKGTSRAARFDAAMGPVGGEAGNLRDVANQLRSDDANERGTARTCVTGAVQAAADAANDAMVGVGELKEELQNWLDNIPENMQNGMKADQLDEAIDTLDSIYSSLESASEVGAVEPVEIDIPDGLWGEELEAKVDEQRDRDNNTAGALDEAADSIEEAAGETPEFPGMY